MFVEAATQDQNACMCRLPISFKIEIFYILNLLHNRSVQM